MMVPIFPAIFWEGGGLIFFVNFILVIGTKPNVLYTKRGLTNRENIHTHYVKKSFKTQHGRIPIDPAILAAIGHRFIAKKNKNKNADARVWGDTRGDQKPETLFWPNGYILELCSYFCKKSRPPT